MTALTDDRNTDFHPTGAILPEPVAATKKIFNGSLCTRNASGYLKPGENTAGEVFAGVADEAANNTGGADGDLKCKLHKKGVHIFAAAGLTQADVGKPLWLDDDQTVTRTPGNVHVGALEYYISATEAPVRIDKGIDNANPFRLFELSAFYPGAVGASEVTVVDNVELPERFEVLRGYADALTAPGSGFNCTVKITDGTTPKTLVIAGTATHGEDEAINQVYAKDTDIDITLQDDNGSAVTADVNLRFICREVP